VTNGKLVLAATPIGDRRDASPALVEALLEADLIAAEDSRRLRALASRLDLTLNQPVLSYFEGNETGRTPELIAALAAGQTVVLVTDAGMPSISDPGLRLVRAAVAAGIRVTAVPGPSAVLTALALSGLATDRFCFEGFLPRQAGPRAARLEALAEETRTLVFFEAPHRLAAWLAAACTAFGPERPAAVCRELTKVHEEVRRGCLADLADWAQGEVLGEITIVVAGATPPTVIADATAISHLVDETLGLIAVGTKPSQAVAEVAKRHSFSRQELYQQVTRTRRSDRPRAEASNSKLPDSTSPSAGAAALEPPISAPTPATPPAAA